MPLCAQINDGTTVDSRAHWLEIDLGASYPVVGLRTQRMQMANFGFPPVFKSHVTEFSVHFTPK